MYLTLTFICPTESPLGFFVDNQGLENQNDLRLRPAKIAPDELLVLNLIKFGWKIRWYNDKRTNTKYENNRCGDEGATSWDGEEVLPSRLVVWHQFRHHVLQNVQAKGNRTGQVLNPLVQLISYQLREFQHVTWGHNTISSKILNNVRLYFKR